MNLPFTSLTSQFDLFTIIDLEQTRLIRASTFDIDVCFITLGMKCIKITFTINGHALIGEKPSINKEIYVLLTHAFQAVTKMTSALVT